MRQHTLSPPYSYPFMTVMESNYPLVSCLCVTERRAEFLKRAVQCYQAQTYVNKELIVVYKDNDWETRAYLEELQVEGLHIIPVDNTLGMTLGDLRNKSVEHSHGSYFCNWDDDDWYHADRLRVQMACLQANYQDASLLSNVLMYDGVNERAYFSDFNFWAGSILCRKAIFTEAVRYPSRKKSEDEVFIHRLIRHCKVYPVISSNLYLYIYHGQNTWEETHFQNMFSESQRLSEPVSRLVKGIVENQLSVTEASERLNEPWVLEELNYLYCYKLRWANVSEPEE